jgi:BA14K-like protein
MSFVIYFFVLIICGVSVMFGFDLLTSPLPTMPNVPIGRTAHLAPLKPETPAAKRADARALTPVYPAAPGGEKKQASTTDTGEATPAAPSKPDEAQAAAVQPAQAKCDLQACAAAYRSFSAADCTYQPYEGPRRLCDKTGVAASTVASSQPQPSAPPTPVALHPAARQAAPQSVPDEVPPAVVQEVRRLAARREDGDPSVEDGEGRTVIAQSGQARASCDVAACAAAYSSFDAADCTYQPYGGPRQLCSK